MRNKFKFIPALLMAIICLSLPTLLSAQTKGKTAQFQFNDTLTRFEMPFSSKFDTAAFRTFIESPEGKKIKSVHQVNRIEYGPSCPNCENPYSRLVYEVESFDNSAPPTKLITEKICYGKFATFKGEKLYESAIRYDKIRSKTGGKDTLLTYVLSVIPRPAKTVIDTICTGEYRLFNGDTLRNNTVRYKNLPAIGNGCDTALTYILNVIPQPTKFVKDSILEGQYAIFNGKRLYETGIYYDTIPAMKGCDTIVTFFLKVKPKPKKFRMFFFVEQTFSFEPGRSQINRDLWTATHIGISGNPAKRWYWKLGLGWYPKMDFRVPIAVPELPVTPAPQDGWNDCNCHNATQQFSVHAGAAYDIPVTEVFGGEAGFRIAVTADKELGKGPVDDLKKNEWALPGAIDLQPGIYWQKELDGGGTAMFEASPTLQALNGSNHVGGQLHLRFVMPTRNDD